MSAAHDDAHAHAPEQPELTHPLLWSVCILAITAFLAWLFFHLLFHGMSVARHHHKIHVHHAGEPEPDHKALMADRSPEVIDAGAAVYNAKCASCHGANGDSNPSNLKPTPRNFHTDGWKNPNGGGPYALYQVLTKGLGTMPAFPGLSPEQRYAVNHYITETWVKTNNKDNYVETDSEEIVKTIPPPGTAGGHGDHHDPAAIEIKVPVRPLMAGLAETAQSETEQLIRWAASAQVDGMDKDITRAFVDLVRSQPGLGLALQAAVKAGDQQRFATLLSGSDGTGAVRADFNCLSSEASNALFASLKGGK